MAAEPAGPISDADGAGAASRKHGDDGPLPWLGERFDVGPVLGEGADAK